jgi:hypothetical protein
LIQPRSQLQQFQSPLLDTFIGVASGLEMTSLCGPQVPSPHSILLMRLVRGRLLFASISGYLLLFTDRGSTGLLTMFLVDTIFALWLGFTIGFGGVERGTLDVQRLEKRR